MTALIFHFIKQQDLNLFDSWCESKSLQLDTKKCNVVKFSRSRFSCDFCYKLRSHVLLEVDEINDLGVMLANKLSFNSHVNYIVNESSKMLGLIKSQTKELRSIKSITSLYHSLVKSKLMYFRYSKLMHTLLSSWSHPIH